MPDFKNEDVEKEVIRIGIEAPKHAGIISPDDKMRMELAARNTKIEELQSRNIELYAQLSVIQSQNNQLATNFEAMSANCDKLVIANEQTHERYVAAEEQARELTIVNERINASYTSLLAINDALQDKLKFTGMTDAKNTENKYLTILYIVIISFLGIIGIIKTIGEVW